MSNALGIVLAVFLFVGGWLARTAYDNSVALQIERVKDAVALVNAESIAKIKVENTTTYAKTVERVKTEQVYGSCVADAVTMELTNSVLKWKY